MWNRVLLKERGKAAFKNNYWRCVLAALVMMIIVGGGSFGTSNIGVQIGNVINNQKYLNDIESYDENYNFNYDDDSFTDNWGIDEFNDLEEVPQIVNPSSEIDSSTFFMIFIAVFIVIFIIALAIGSLIGFLVLNPLEVGCRKFFMENSEGRGENVGNIAFGFSSSYGNIVKVQFFKSLSIILWTFVFIIPGIIKEYEYMLVPYLLAENPNMDRKEALETSKRLMYGNKLDVFILRLSFLGWNILSLFTLGLLGIFYVNPYMYATEAELYRVISGKISGMDNGEAERQAELARLYGGVRESNSNEEDVYVTFEEPKETSTFD